MSRRSRPHTICLLRTKSGSERPRQSYGSRLGMVISGVVIHFLLGGFWAFLRDSQRDAVQPSRLSPIAATNYLRSRDSR